MDYAVTNTMYDEGTVGTIESRVSIRKHGELLAVIQVEQTPGMSDNPAFQTQIHGWYLDGEEFVGYLHGGAFLIGHDKQIGLPSTLGAMTSVHGVGLRRVEDGFRQVQLDYPLTGENAYTQVREDPPTYERRIPSPEGVDPSLQLWNVLALDPESGLVAESRTEMRKPFAEGKVTLTRMKTIVTEWQDGLPVAFERFTYEGPRHRSATWEDFLKFQARIEAGDEGVLSMRTRMKEIDRGPCTAEEASLSGVAENIRIVRVKGRDKNIPVAGLKLGEPYDGPWATYDPGTRTFVIQ